MVHRLLKNSIVETTRHRRPTRSTPTRAWRRAGIDRPARRSGWSEHHETYEHVGEVTGWVHDLAPAWTAGAGPHASSSSSAGTAIVDIEMRPPGARRDRLGLPDVAGPPPAWQDGHRPCSTRQRRRADAASARSTTASTARTRSSRRSSTGGRSITSRSAPRCPMPGVPKFTMHVRPRAERRRHPRRRCAIGRPAVDQGPGDRSSDACPMLEPMHPGRRGRAGRRHRRGDGAVARPKPSDAGRSPSATVVGGAVHPRAGRFGGCPFVVTDDGR